MFLWKTNVGKFMLSELVMLTFILMQCLFWYIQDYIKSGINLLGNQYNSFYSREDPKRTSTVCPCSRLVQTDPDTECLLSGGGVPWRRSPWNNVGSPGWDDWDSCKTRSKISICWYVLLMYLINNWNEGSKGHPFYCHEHE